MPRRKDSKKAAGMPRKRSRVPPPGYAMDDGRKGRKRLKRAEDDLAEYAEDAQEPPPTGEISPRRASPHVGIQPHVLSIVTGELKATATLNRSATARTLWAALPISGRAKPWGDEVYFEIPLTCPPENAQADLPSGTIAYWPEGDCFCIFFGQKPYSPVNVLGTLQCDPDIFRKVKEGDEISLLRME